MPNAPTSQEGAEQAPFELRLLMDTNTLIIIIVVVILLGGGGFYFRRR
jgi:LPXTG-motif cell wall-anchored protein